MEAQNDDKTDSGKVLEVLEDGRANPYHLRKRTGLSKQRINRILNRLQANDRVEKVNRGLYELAEDPDIGSVGDPTEVEMELECPHCEHTEQYTPGEVMDAIQHLAAHVAVEHGDDAGDSR